jgi:hypothetical protein
MERSKAARYQVSLGLLRRVDRGRRREVWSVCWQTGHGTAAWARDVHSPGRCGLYRGTLKASVILTSGAASNHESERAVPVVVRVVIIGGRLALSCHTLRACRPTESQRTSQPRAPRICAARQPTAPPPCCVRFFCFSSGPRQDSSDARLLSLPTYKTDITAPSPLFHEKRPDSHFEW